MPVTS